MGGKTGLPIYLIKFLRDTLDVKTFIETGTGLGRTAKIAGELFNQVYTIEADYERWKYNKNQFDGTNITCIYGESPGALEQFINGLDNERLIIFLDAHCSYRNQVVENNPCPVLDEISVIPNGHVVIIDDAHSFTYPHKVKEVAGVWPELTQVVNALDKRNNPYIFIDGKSIVSVPRTLKANVQIFTVRNSR